MGVIKQNGVLGQLSRDPWLVLAGDRVYDCLMQVDLTDKERDILIRRKKRSDAHKLVRMKVEAGLSMPQQMRVTVGSKKVLR